ncbi:MAG: hypothetical protein J0H71_09160 [Rhizobiales bacterium]|nr:hypothetical protein [Hyphomicrobiales bacterium]
MATTAPLGMAVADVWSRMTEKLEDIDEFAILSGLPIEVRSAAFEVKPDSGD